MKNIFIVIAFLLGLSFSLEASWKNAKCPDKDAMAKRLLEGELAGLRLSTPNNVCLKQLSAEFISAEPKPVNDAINGKTIAITAKDSYSIKNIEKVEDADEIYRVKFDVEKFEANGKKAVFNDSFLFIVYKGAMKELSGCAVIASEPKNMYVKEECLGK